MSGLERNCRLCSAQAAFDPRLRSQSRTSIALRFPRLAALWVIRKLFLVKEKLFTCREHKLSPAIHTNQISINKTHDSIPILRPEPPASHLWNGAFRLPCLQLTTHRCPLEGAVKPIQSHAGNRCGALCRIESPSRLKHYISRSLLCRKERRTS